MLGYLYQFSNWSLASIGSCFTSFYRWYFSYQPTITYTPKPKKKIPAKTRINVWRRQHGDSFIGKCYACGCHLDYQNKWHCSHIVAEAKGGSIEVENLRPCCEHCNCSMRDINLYAYISLKRLSGPGSLYAEKYLRLYPDQRCSSKKNQTRSNISA